MICTISNCDDCPYSDCIAEAKAEKKKRGRKKMDPAIVRQHRLDYNKRYYRAHKTELNEKAKERYHEKKNT